MKLKCPACWKFVSVRGLCELCFRSVYLDYAGVDVWDDTEDGVPEIDAIDERMREFRRDYAEAKRDHDLNHAFDKANDR